MNIKNLGACYIIWEETSHQKRRSITSESEGSRQAQLIAKQVIVLKVLALNSNDVDFL